MSLVSILIFSLCALCIAGDLECKFFTPKSGGPSLAIDVCSQFRNKSRSEDTKNVTSSYSFRCEADTIYLEWYPLSDSCSGPSINSINGPYIETVDVNCDGYKVCDNFVVRRSSQSGTNGTCKESVPNNADFMEFPLVLGMCFDNAARDSSISLGCDLDIFSHEIHGAQYHNCGSDHHDHDMNILDECDSNWPWNEFIDWSFTEDIAFPFFDQAIFNADSPSYNQVLECHKAPLSSGTSPAEYITPILIGLVLCCGVAVAICLYLRRRQIAKRSNELAYKLNGNANDQTAGTEDVGF